MPFSAESTLGPEAKQTVLCEISDSIATVTLNRPKALNSLDGDLIMRAREIFTELEADSSVRCVILRGAEGNFMAGGDIKMFHDVVGLSSDARRATFESFVHELHPLIFTMRRMRQPIIACVEGACAGAGVSVAIGCDLVIAAESSMFCLAYTMLGTSPDGSSTFSLPRLVGLKKAMQIAMLNERMPAVEAERIGLINKVVADDQLEEELGKWATKLAAGPTHALGNTKRLLNNSFDHQLAQQLLLEAENFADCASREDFVEGVNAFVEKRKPQYTGN